MLSGVKFIPRDQVQEESLDATSKARDRSISKKGKHRRSKKPDDSSSSDHGEHERITNRPSKRKWYSSNEDSSSCSSENDNDAEFDCKKKKHKQRNMEKRSRKNANKDPAGNKLKRSKSRRKSISSEDDSLSTFDYDDEMAQRRHGRREQSSGVIGKERKKDLPEDDTLDGIQNKEIRRKEVGLEWMIRPDEKIEKTNVTPSDPSMDEHQVEDVRKDDPKELNPYLKDSGCGYPEEADNVKAGASQLLSSSIVGDGGASWRLKAMKRAQEQAAREGRKFDEVVEERWGPLGNLAVSAVSHRAAPARAHLHAIRNRKKTITEESDIAGNNETEKAEGSKIFQKDGRDYLKDVSLRNHDMRAPKSNDCLSWRKQKGQKYSDRDSGIISNALSSLNKFSNDGNFMRDFMHQENGESGGSREVLGQVEADSVPSDISKHNDDSSVVKETLSANQLAAKALQLRMKGRHEEADKLMKESEILKVKQASEDNPTTQQNEESRRRSVRRDATIQQKQDENYDAHLGKWIMNSKQYSVAKHADDEYDYDDGPSRKNKKKRGNELKLADKSKFPKQVMTQQERCQFCFENPRRPRHLSVSIANFTYLMLPPWEPIVPGHCYLLPLQHESATRTIDDDVWEELRNFKKCLIMMFAKQDKDLVFLETVMELSQQRRHCMIECIPLPRDIAKQAPLYFKKAIDEAEDEWSQHNAKRLIETSVKGLRSSVPKGFPYFHVEFGLNRGFVHVIDDEKNFKKNLGLDVIRGMLKLPAEDMHRRGRYESVDIQKQAVASFMRDWEPFDWTKQLE